MHELKLCKRNAEGLLHSEDGPALEYVNGQKEWWVDGRLHRLDGPAIKSMTSLHSYDTFDEYYIDGRYIYKELYPENVIKYLLECPIQAAAELKNFIKQNY